MTCTSLQWMLQQFSLLPGAGGALAPTFPAEGMAAQATEGKLGVPGFSQEFGTAGTKNSCRCGRKIFTALPTIKSSERGDLCVWDKGGDTPPPQTPFRVQYMEI